MKHGNYLTLSALLGGVIFSSCSDYAPEINPYEDYNRAFIETFGIPADGQDFSMATAAGLKVKTSKGAKIRVTCDIEGKDYLLADLYLPAGTHELPVIIPEFITEVKIKTDQGILVAGANDLVDLDSAPASRAGDWEVGTYENAYPAYITQGSQEGPWLVFDPADLLADYFAANPTGQDNTNYWYQQDKNGVIKYDSGFNKQVFYGETAIGDGGTWNGHNHDMSYYVFPVWWRSQPDGKRDYRFYLFGSRQLPNHANGLTGNLSEMWFEQHYLHTEDWKEAPEKTTATNPFPELGISSSVIPLTDLATDDPVSKFDCSDGTWTQAYDRNNLPVQAISRGFKIRFTNKTKSSDGASIRDQDFSKLEAGRMTLGFALKCNDGTNCSYSVPHQAREMWKPNYFDQTLENLFFANTSTMRTMLPDKEFTIRENTYVGDKLDHLADGWDFKNIGTRSGAFLIGFNSQPSKAADTSVGRDYADAIFLVVPVNDDQTDFDYIYEENSDPITWTIAAEDLGSTDDWDFNDAVFTFTSVITNLNHVNKNRKATLADGPLDAVSVNALSVTPMAAGGTLPLYLVYTQEAAEMPGQNAHGDDELYSHANAELTGMSNADIKTGHYIIGQEIHEWLGGSVPSIINTGSKRLNLNGRTVEFVIPIGKKQPTNQNALSQFFKDHVACCGFVILVDKDRNVTLSSDSYFQPYDLDQTPGNYVLTGPNPTEGMIAPQMICILGDWEWPTERTMISDAYPDFNNWVSWLGNMYRDWCQKPEDRSRITQK